MTDTPKPPAAAKTPSPLVETTERRSRSQAHVNYLGAAGESLTAYHLSLLGYAVSVPLNDQGDDLFAVDMSSDRVRRVQVKTASKKSELAGAGGAYAQFQVGLKPLHLDRDTPDLIFCFHLLVETAPPRRSKPHCGTARIRAVYVSASPTVTLLIQNDRLATDPIYLVGSPPARPTVKPSKKTVVDVAALWENRWTEVVPRVVNIHELTTNLPA